MNLKTFQKTFNDYFKTVDGGLDSISDLLDELDSEDDRPTAARDALVKAQLAVADLRTKSLALEAEDVEPNELEDRDEEDEEEDEEAE